MMKALKILLKSPKVGGIAIAEVNPARSRVEDDGKVR